MFDREFHEVREGLHLHCLSWGSNTANEVPFVLVHGLASNARLWDGVARHLADLDHFVVAIDQRGHGLSTKPDEGFDMDTVAHDLALLVDVLELDRPVVVGQSWGGNVVVELAASYPRATRGVCAVDGGIISLKTHYPDWSDCAEALAPPHLVGMPAKRMEAAIRSAHPDWSEDGIQGALACMELRDDGTIAPWLTRERHMKVLHGLWEHDPFRLFSDMTVPVMFMPAINDHVSGWAADKRTAVERAALATPKSRIVWFDGADHDLHAQHPRRVANELHQATHDGFFS
jgi:pimeloyl-ACP methyl ester carboxylesterase